MLNQFYLTMIIINSTLIDHFNFKIDFYSVINFKKPKISFIVMTRIMNFINFEMIKLN